MTSNDLMILAPVLFPIITGFALFSRPIFEDRHVYVGVMTFLTAIITFFSAFMTNNDLIVLWKITSTLSIAFRMDYPARAFSCLVAFGLWLRCTHLNIYDEGLPLTDFMRFSFRFSEF